MDSQPEGVVMKKPGMILLIAASLLGLGCARPNELGYTPAYTTRERTQMILRNWDYEGKQKDDDIDMILMLRPASHLTIWDVR